MNQLVKKRVLIKNNWIKISKAFTGEEILTVIEMMLPAGYHSVYGGLKVCVKIKTCKGRFRRIYCLFFLSLTF